MTGITHQEARKLLMDAQDGVLEEHHRDELEQHLETCADCRTFAADLERLSVALQRSFHERWDIRHGPSKDLIQNVFAGQRRIQMANRTANVAKVLAILTVLLVLALFSGYVIQRMRPGTAIAQTPVEPTQLIEATLTPIDIATFTPEPPIEYIVQTGDSCISIANLFGSSVAAIVTLNGLNSSCTDLMVGQTLKIPRPPATLQPPNATRAACETVSYTVQANDTLSTIATSYAVSIEAIKKWNGLNSNNVIPGQVLNITLCMQTVTPGPASSSPAYHGLVAFVSEVSGQPEIYTMHPDGSDMKDLTNNHGKNYSPAWSPDGSRIAFVSERRGNADIFIMNADGSGVTQLTNNLGYDGFLNWSPDGQKIAYLSSTGQDPNVAQLFVMNVDGSDKIPLTKESGSYVFISWSPDDQQIVYENQPSTSADDTVIYVVKVDGTDRREVMPGITGAIDSYVRWQDDSDFDAVVGFTPWQLYRLNIAGMPPQLLASEGTPISAWFDANQTLTYIVKRSDNWTWYRLQGTIPQLQNSWTFSTKCQSYKSDLFLNDANISLSPDGTQGLVSVYCDEGLTWFYLVNADGSNTKLLLDDPLPFWVENVAWSPNGQYIFFTLGNNQTGHGDLYVIDMEKTLKDPSTPPIHLTNDDALKYDSVCQPTP